MTSLLSAVQTALNTNTNINLEVLEQLEIARDLIGTRQAAQTLSGKLLHLVPRLVKEHTVEVSFKDSREQDVVVDKELNDIMWVIALQTTLQNGHATTAGLVGLFQQWAKEHKGANWEAKSVRPIAKRFINEMVHQHLIQSEITVVSDDKLGQLRVRKLTDAQQQEVVDMVEELRLNA